MKNERHGVSGLKVFLLIIITIIVTFTVTYVWIYGGGRFGKASTGNSLSSALKSDSVNTKLISIRSRIDTDYIGNVDENELTESAIKGYVNGLGDEYSEYYTKDEMQEFTSDVLGKYVGIGVYMTVDKNVNKIMVYNVMKNSPAEAVGLQAGDYIVAVDGTECTGDDFENTPDKIKGKEGTKVKITIERNGNKTDYDIERKSIEITRVASTMLDNEIGYIYISSFDGEVAKQFKNEYDSLVNQGMKSLIIDLRNNGGGIVTEATDIGDLFTNKGKTLLTEVDKQGDKETIDSKNDRTITMNTCVLVNQYSASASEILAGIMQDLVDNATIIGETTYGKGVIQTLYQLSDGSGLKLTTDEYLTPNGNKINKVGIKPDIEVKDYTFKGTLDKENDTQLKKAIETLNK